MNLPKVAVIPAAGKGTRFLPSTKATPKEMHPLLNLPLVHHCSLELQAAGVEKIVLVIHPEKETLKKYFNTDEALSTHLMELGKTELANRVKGVNKLPKVEFAYQTEQKGLAHAVACAKDSVGSDDFFLLLPDEIFIPHEASQNPCVELLELYKKTEKSTVTLLEVPKDKVSSYGVIAGENKETHYEISGIIEKPAVSEAPSNLILPGRYLFKNSIFTYIEGTQPSKNGEVQLTDAMEKLAHSEGLLGKPTSCPRFDGGSVLGFLKANIYAGLKDPELSGPLKTFIQGL